MPAGAIAPPSASIQVAIDEILARHPAVGLAVGIVRDGRLEQFHGHGVADIASRTPIDEDTVFRVASITKTVTAVAVMQLWEQGLIDLDAPANDYLRAFRLIPARAGHRPATVRDLLTHTAGLPETLRPWGALQPDFGESVASDRPVPTLAQLYGGALRLAAEPGTRFVYGNHSPATLGQIVEDVSGEPLDRYFRGHIFEPLGMTGTDLGRSERIRSRLATGYEMGAAGARAVPERELVTRGAASVCSSPRDMSRYLAALLGGGSNERGSVLQPATVASMFEPQYRPDPRIAGMGLAFFRIDVGGHRAVEHQGTLPGFHSQILLAPDDGVGVMAFTNGSWQADFWLPAEMGALLEQLLGVERGPRPLFQAHPERWGECCGWYQLDASLTDIRLRGMFGAGLEVFVRAGQLMARFLSPIPEMYRGFALAPDSATDPDVYRIDLSAFGGSGLRLVFGRGPGGDVTAVHLDMMPVTLRRQAARKNPRLWATGLLGAAGAGAAALVLRRAMR
jgi:CubicO group peptidase (beta-lactamase class C family)